MSKLEEIRKLRAQGMTLAEAKEKVCGSVPKKIIDEAATLVRAFYIQRMIELRKTGLPLADAKAQADREFHKVDGMLATYSDGSQHLHEYNKCA